MKRLPLVAIGVALCALTTGAEARSEGMRLGAHASDTWFYADGEWVRPQARRRSARIAKRRRSAYRPARRHRARGGRRAGVVQGRPARQRRSVAFTRRGGPSRTCLTPAARGLLARIEAEFGKIRVVSTCRPGAVIAGSGRPSRHASGNAVDFVAPAGKKSDVVRWLIANHRAGGVMTYARMSHIHVDIGRRFVSLASGRRWR